MKVASAIAAVARVVALIFVGGIAASACDPLRVDFRDAPPSGEECGAALGQCVIDVTADGACNDEVYCWQQASQHCMAVARGCFPGAPDLLEAGHPVEVGAKVLGACLGGVEFNAGMTFEVTTPGAGQDEFTFSLRTWAPSEAVSCVEDGLLP